MYDVIIIGGGIGGAAAALRSAQNGQKGLWLLGDNQTRKESRSQWVKNLDNIVGFHEDVIKEQVIKSLKKKKEFEAIRIIESEHYYINNRGIIKNTIDRLNQEYPGMTITPVKVENLGIIEEGFRVETKDEKYRGAAVVMATGVMDEHPQFEIINRKGELEKSPKWVYPFANREQFLYCTRCEGHLTREDSVAVIGTSGIAIELSLVMYERYNNPVYLLTNGQEINIDSDQSKLFEHYGIRIIKDKITGIITMGKTELNGFEFSDHDPLLVKFALVAMGLYRVYNDLARQINARLMNPNLPEEKRHIWIDKKGETSIPNFFVVGDAANREDEVMMKQVYTAQEYAVRAIDTIDYRKRHNRRKQFLR